MLITGSTYFKSAFDPKYPGVCGTIQNPCFQNKSCHEWTENRDGNLLLMGLQGWLPNMRLTPSVDKTNTSQVN